MAFCDLKDFTFTAPWITPEPETSHPMLVRNFSAKEGEAKLYITGLGLYEAYLNGEKIGDSFLSPGFTEYDLGVRFQVYDVTALLKEENRLCVILGNGWYKGRFGLTNHEDIYGSKYLLAAELWQGKENLWKTDLEFETWKSGFISSGIYDGEVFDANIIREKIGGVKFSDCAFPITPPEGVPICAHEEFTPILINTPKRETVLDFGQNMAGIVRMHVNAPKGTKVILQAGEILQDECFYRDNLREAPARFEYISDGAERTVWQHFTYYGFRYMKVEGLSEVNPSDFTAVALYSDLEETLDIKTSNPLINQLISNTRWGQKSNFMDIATDCPQRNERLGWTGDTQVFAATACYQMNCLPFYEKIFTDLRREQLRYGGNVPNYAPSVHMETEGGCAAWSDIATILPWTVYTWYGDLELLKKSYPLMRDYSEFLIRRDNEHGATHLYHEGGFGDWLAGDGVCDTSFEGGTDIEFISVVYYYNSVRLTSMAAALLGIEEDKVRYEKQAKSIKDTIFKEYYTETGRFALDTQASYALALYFELYKDKKKLVDAFKSRLEKDLFEIKTGFVGTPLLLPALFDAGMDDYAYRILLNEDFPGWLFEVKMGATTIWERWNSVLPDGSISGTGMNSLNHYAYGSVCQAIYGYIAGLSPLCAGWKRAEIAPRPNYRLKSIDMTYKSPAGNYHVDWELKDDGALSVNIVIPGGAEAVVKLPGYEKEKMTLGAGKYNFDYTPAVDFKHPFSADSYLYDLVKSEEAVQVLNEFHGAIYPMAKGSPEFLSWSLNTLMNKSRMCGPNPDLSGVDALLKKITC